MDKKITVMVDGVEMKWVDVRSKEELKPGDRIRYSCGQFEIGVYGGIGSNPDWTPDNTDNPRMIGEDGEFTGSTNWSLSQLMENEGWRVQVLRPSSQMPRYTEDDFRELKDALSETVYCLRQYIGYTKGCLDGQAELERAEQLLERQSLEGTKGKKDKQGGNG